MFAIPPGQISTLSGLLSRPGQLKTLIVPEGSVPVVPNVQLAALAMAVSHSSCVPVASAFVLNAMKFWEGPFCPNVNAVWLPAERPGGCPPVLLFELGSNAPVSSSRKRCSWLAVLSGLTTLEC